MANPSHTGGLHIASLSATFLPPYPTMPCHSSPSHFCYQVTLAIAAHPAREHVWLVHLLQPLPEANFLCQRVSQGVVACCEGRYKSISVEGAVDRRVLNKLLNKPVISVSMFPCDDITRLQSKNLCRVSPGGPLKVSQGHWHEASGSHERRACQVNEAP